MGNPVTDFGTIVPESGTMPSTDIDGSVIVILTEDEAHRVHEYLSDQSSFDVLERNLARKIERDLKLPRLSDATCDDCRPANVRHCARCIGPLKQPYETGAN